MFSGCIIEHDLPDLDGAAGLWVRMELDPETGEEAPVPYTGTASHAGPGYRNRRLEITLSFEAGLITSVEFDLRTQTHGAAILHNIQNTVRGRLLLFNTLEDHIFIDAVADSTGTLVGLRNAARQAVQNAGLIIYEPE